MRKIYVQLQVDFDDDPDVAKLARYRRPREARAARELLISMWRYCKRERSDGHVPLEVVGKLAYPDSEKVAMQDVERLVEVGVAERTDTGYYLPGYLKHNKSRAQIEAEIARKAEAGKKGGQASGMVRRGEAETKQSASPSRSQRTENREQRTENNVELKQGEERPQTLRAVNATKPPTCSTHPNGDHDGPCGGCAKVREYHARLEAAAKAEAAERARNCPTCEGMGFVLDADKQPTGRKCTHERRAS